MNVDSYVLLDNKIEATVDATTANREKVKVRYKVKRAMFGSEYVTEWVERERVTPINTSFESIDETPREVMVAQLNHEIRQKLDRLDDLNQLNEYSLFECVLIDAGVIYADTTGFRVAGGKNFRSIKALVQDWDKKNQHKVNRP